MLKRVFAVLLALVMATACAGALAEGTITVQGAGVVHVDADCAKVHMGVREVASDVMTAQSAVNDRIAAVIASLNDMGIATDAIATDGIGIYPNYDYSGNETITGYNANNSLCVTVKDVQNVGAVIDAAFAAGANSLDYVEFYTSDTAEASDRALALAVESAKQKAQVLADAAGVKLGAILEIRDGSENSWYDTYGAYARSEEVDTGMGAGTQVLASRQQVNASVILTFAIDPAE